MSDWQEENVGPQAARRMLRRACRARGVDASTTDLYRVTGARCRTDGITTLAVVTLFEVGLGLGLGSDAYVHGYGMATRAVDDEHSEHVGANRAIRRAMECAATVIAHRCVAGRMRAALDRKLEMAVLTGQVADGMRAMLAESDRARRQP